LKFNDASFSLGYLHKVYTVKSFFDIFIGASYNTQIVNKTDNFSSKLYENYLGYKDCSDITYANFSISALFRFVLNKNSLLFNPAFSIMNFSERTNNNFKGTYNKLYFINNYTGYQCSLAYTRNLSDHFDLKLQYSLQYEDYKYSTDSRILKKISSFGITYKF
jgi:hypothetical protein